MEAKDPVRALIAESGVKLGYIAERLGLSRAALRDKLDGRTSWKLVELAKLQVILHAPDAAFWPRVAAIAKAAALAANAEAAAKKGV